MANENSNYRVLIRATHPDLGKVVVGLPYYSYDPPGSGGGTAMGGEIVEVTLDDVERHLDWVKG